MGNRNIIISPSGNLYGSENVLFDFLKGSSHKYDVYVPENSDFFVKLKEENYNVYGYNNLKLLYIRIFVRMLFTRKNLFLNEAGHITYIKILAKLLKKKRFVVVVRLLEDCNKKINILPNNITLIAVSNYIKKQIVSNCKVIVVHDPYQLKNISTKSIRKEQSGQIVVGVVGRIVETKGIGILPELFGELSVFKRKEINLNLYGTFDKNSEWFNGFKNRLDDIEGLSYSIVGFIADQEQIYNNCDLILHLNKVEAFGRIIFEAVDHNVPFLCFAKGGAGELAELLNLSNLAIPNENMLVSKLNTINKIELVNDTNFQEAKAIITREFGWNRYARNIEEFL